MRFREKLLLALLWASDRKLIPPETMREKTPKAQ
jgi:hypothetical protein